MNVHDVSPTELDEDLRQLRLRLGSAALFILAVMLVGIVGYRVIDPGVGWVDAFYMTAITLTTVGFGEIVDMTARPGGRIFTVLLILVGMGGVLYLVTTATAFIVEGQIGHIFRRRKLEKTIASMSGHLIVCGAGDTAAYTTRELLSVRRQVVLICEKRDQVDYLRSEIGDTPLIVGDPASDEVLLAAGVERAAGIVACTDNDKENVVITLSARQLNPTIRIVSRITDIDSEDKIRRVGADAVVSPTYIGGLRLASELIRPTVVNFLDVMLRDRDANLRIDEITIPESSPAAGKRVRELGLDKMSNALLMAMRSPSGQWHYNPGEDQEVTAGTVLIFLGSPEDMRGLCDQLGGVVVSKPAAAGA